MFTCKRSRLVTKRETAGWLALVTAPFGTCCNAGIFLQYVLRWGTSCHQACWIVCRQRFDSLRFHGQWQFSSQCVNELMQPVDSVTAWTTLCVRDSLIYNDIFWQLGTNRYTHIGVHVESRGFIRDHNSHYKEFPGLKRSCKVSVLHRWRASGRNELHLVRCWDSAFSCMFLWVFPLL